MWIQLVLIAGAAFAAPAPRDTATYASLGALAQYARARLLEESGNDSAALDAYYRVLANDPLALDALRKAGELTAQQGDHLRSLEFADRLLALDPGNGDGLWLKGAAEFNLGRREDALRTLDRAVAAEPRNAEYWRTLARVAEGLDRLDRVEQAYARATDLEPDDGEAWFQLAGARARMGRFAGADSALSESRERNPMRPGTDFLQGWVDEGLGRDSSAIAMYSHHLHLHSDDVVTRQRLVALLAGRERWKDAWREARRVRESRPTLPEALETEADLAFRAGEPAAAREPLQRLQRLDPADPQLTWRAAVVLSHHGRSAEGITLASAWTRAHRGDFRGPLLLARTYALAGDTDRALAAAREAGAMAPDSLAPQVALGRIAQDAKRWREAATVWEGLRRRYPRLVPLALDQALCLEQLDDIDGAVAAAREALEVAPSNPGVQNFLGYLLADHNRDLEQAHALLLKAVAADPDNGAFLDSLGWVLYRLGKLDQARAHLERAVTLTDGDAVVLDHLGDVYRDLRLLDLAREQYRRSLAADSSNHKVRNKLEAIR